MWVNKKKPCYFLDQIYDKNGIFGELLATLETREMH